MRVSKGETKQRREKVKELYLKNLTLTEIAKQTESSVTTVSKDVQYWQTYYTKLALNNPHIAQMQFERLQKLLDEVEMIKREFWTTYEEAKNDARVGVRAKIETLKAILVRIDQEAKLLGLFNPQTLIVNNYISMDGLKTILGAVKDVIIEMVPEDKRVEAIDRLKKLEVTPKSGKEIIDAEIAEDE